MTLGQQTTESIGERRPVVLTARDRELLVHLAVARYLSGEQIRKLMFPGKADSITRRRLSILVSGKFPYVRRLPFRTREGRPIVAWSPTHLGYMAARNAFAATPKRPADDAPGAGFLERSVRLNELYVALASAARQRTVALDRWPFRWISGDLARLRWTEVTSEGKSIGRVLRPDATLKLSSQSHRIFIDVEAGTQVLDFRRFGARGHDAIVAKMKLFRSFALAGYSETFNDSWSAELLFVVPTKNRRDAIAEVADISRCQSQQMGRFTIQATTLDEAPGYLCHAARLPMLPTFEPHSDAEGIPLTSVEIRALYNFYNDAIATIAAARRLVRSNPGFVLDLPEYPPNHEIVKEFCARLGKLL